MIAEQYTTGLFAVVAIGLLAVLGLAAMFLTLSRGGARSASLPPAPPRTASKPHALPPSGREDAGRPGVVKPRGQR